MSALLARFSVNRQRELPGVADVDWLWRYLRRLRFGTQPGACVVVALRQRYRRKTGGGFSQLSGRSAPGRGFVPPTSEVELSAVTSGQAAAGSTTFAGALPPSAHGQGWGAAQAVTSASSGGDEDDT